MLFGAALFTACAIDVALIERLARAPDRPLPRKAEWYALCSRLQHRYIWPASLSAIAALVASVYLQDDRWQVGAGLMIGALCYTWDTILPAGAVLGTLDPARTSTIHLTRARFRAYALRHYPLIALGLSALAAFAWAHY
jgi:hypothetical protein